MFNIIPRPRHGNATRRLTSLAVALVLALLAGHAFAESAQDLHLKFVNVIDSTQGLSDFSQFPALNNHGDVAFLAFQNGSEQDVFKWNRRELRTIASTTGSTFTSFSDDVAINSSGVVGFRATLSTARRASGIFTSNGITTRTIVDSTNALLGVSAFGIGPPSINASGTVAFEALRSNLRSGLIFTGNGGALTPVLDTLSSNFGSFGAVAINDSGAIVFNGTLKDRNQGVFRLTPNIDENGKAQAPTSFTLIDIVDTNNPDFFQFGDPVINNAGTVADDAGGPARVEIFTGNSSGITDRTDPSSGFFAEFEHPSINNRGAVAFSVIEASGAQGIFVELTGGSSPVAVLQSGDALFGSTVTAVSVGRFGFNDHFRLAFEYELADGRSGIAVALLHSDDADGDDPEQSDSAK